MTIPQEHREELRSLAMGAGHVGATAHLPPTSVLALLDALDAAEHRATRAESRSNIRQNQTLYWQRKAQNTEARIAAVRATIDQAEQDDDETTDRYPTPHGNGQGPALVDTDTIRQALDT